MPLWWENDAPRGLVYKAVTEFQLAPGEYHSTIDHGVRRAIDAFMGVLGIALLLFAIMELWRWRGPDRDTLCVLGAFATAIVLHHLISPFPAPSSRMRSCSFAH